MTEFVAAVLAQWNADPEFQLNRCLQDLSLWLLAKVS